MATSEFLAGSKQDELQSLRERISELDEQVANLQRLEETIKRNNRLFEALLVSSKDGIALTRPDATVIRIIKSALDYGSTEVTGLSIFDLIHPDDRVAMRQCYAELMKGHGSRVRHEVRMLSPDGSPVWVESTVTNMLDDPNVQAIVHNYRNITQRKAAEITGLEFAALIEQAPFALFSKDLEGKIQSWNIAAERTFGYASAEIIGQHIWRLVPKENQSDEAAMRNEVIRTGTSIGPIPAIRVHKDKTQIPVQLTLVPMIEDGHVRGILQLSQTLAASNES